MYIINIFVYGHNFSKNKRINNNVAGLDLEFYKTINKRDFQVSIPYHGGKVAGDIQSVICGHIITHDYRSSSYVDTIRKAKEEEYKDDYLEFVEFFIKDLEKKITEDSPEPDEYWSESDIEDWKDELNEIIEFLKNNEPEFYSVEESS